MSRTGAYWQTGIGNFFLSECCYKFLEAWIARPGLPPMWDGRSLSFAGELWEVVNSRETGRSECLKSRQISGFMLIWGFTGIDNIGHLDWLEPGGAEKKLEQTQYELATGGAYPVRIAEALREGYDRDGMKTCMLDDYGLWMFASPHE